LLKKMLKVLQNILLELLITMLIINSYSIADFYLFSTKFT